MAIWDCLWAQVNKVKRHRDWHQRDSVVDTIKRIVRQHEGSLFFFFLSKPTEKVWFSSLVEQWFCCVEHVHEATVGRIRCCLQRSDNSSRGEAFKPWESSKLPPTCLYLWCEVLAWRCHVYLWWFHAPRSVLGDFQLPFPRASFKPFFGKGCFWFSIKVKH